jgi:hypothetical protein
MEEGESSKEEGEDGKYGKNGEKVRSGMETTEAGWTRNERGGEGRYYLRGGVGKRQREGGGGGVPRPLDTGSIDLCSTMMRQLTTLFAEMGNLGGGRMLRSDRYDW